MAFLGPRRILLLLLACIAGSSGTPLEVFLENAEDYFAAQELQRYIYRTGLPLPAISKDIKSLKGAKSDNKVVLARVDSKFGRETLRELNCGSEFKSFSKHGSHLVHSMPNGRYAAVVLSNSTVGVLYGAYSLLETLFGIVFQIDDDLVPVIPEVLNYVLPRVECKVFEPAFKLRGMHPFHDFPSGPDWWSEDDFKAFLEAMTRLKQNFIGLHSYPWQKKNAEPTVWVGTEDSLGPDGSIKPQLPGAYPSGWTWSSKKQPSYTYVESTTDLPFGVNMLFHHRCFCSPIQQEYCPRPKTPAAATVFFDRAHSFLRSIFTYGKQSGIKSCVGVEVPLTKPTYSDAPLASSEEYFKGIFRRIMSTKGYDLDYFWLWTSEAWIAHNVQQNSTLYREALADYAAAARARDAVGAPWKLATSGWVVGPLPDRSVFDRELPPGYEAIGSIDKNVGNSPVDPAYAKIRLHEKWVIPWIEDDPGLTEPQIWVNRTLVHIEDALKYDVNGLFGVHWRTSAVAPTITAMATKSWQRSLTSPSFFNSWCQASFGKSAGRVLAPLFSNIDGSRLPRPATWVQGPGGLFPSKGQCNQARSSYSFLRDFAAVDTSAMTTEEKERYDFWWEAFHFMFSSAKFSCAWSEAEAVIADILKVSPSDLDAVSAMKKSCIPSLSAKRAQMVANATQMMSHFMATVKSKSDYGIAFNLASHSLLKAFASQEQRVQPYSWPKLQPIPDSLPEGKCRLILPTRRTVSTSGQLFVLEATFLARKCQFERFELHYVSLGSTAEPGVVAFKRIGEVGCAFQASLRPETSFEWYAMVVSDQCPSGEVRFPTDAPARKQTVVLKEQHTHHVEVVEEVVM